MSIVFYHTPMTSSVPVHWALEELGVAYEAVVVDLKKGEQKKPEYLRLNPNGKVPTLVHDGKPIFESLAINLYLGETFGVAKGLYPAPGPKRAETLQWMVWAQVSMGSAFSRLLHATSSWVPAEQHNAAAGEAAKQDLRNLISILNDALKGKSFIVDDRFSLADVQVGTWVYTAEKLGIALTGYANVQRFRQALSDRPARLRAMPPGDTTKGH